MVASHLFTTIILFASLCLPNKLTAQGEPPFSVLPLYDLQEPNTLGLEYAEGLETFTIFSPGEHDNKYNHGVVLFPFKGKLYAQWQSSSVDEDGEDTQIYYSISEDGEKWAQPIALTEPWDKGIRTSGGWWSNGSTLVAFIGVWPNFHDGSKQGHTEYMTSIDGLTWQAPRHVSHDNGEPVMGIIEQDLRSLPDGRIITAFHMQPGLKVKPYYTDDPLGITNWKAGEMPLLPSNNPQMSREIEPSWFYRKDSAIVMVFRDQHSTYKKLASISHDRGKTWTTPVIIDTPDSRAKQSAGNLPDGTAFLVDNPTGSKQRYPLVITLSEGGFLFNKAFLIRSGNNLQA